MTNNMALRDYFQEYCNKVDMTLNQLYSKSRKRDLVEKRMVLMYTLRKSVGMTFHNIGDSLKKDHATIIYAVKTIEEFIKLLDKNDKLVYPNIQVYYDIADEALTNHKENLIEYYRSPIFTEIERNRALVDILLDNNDKLKSKIKQLKKELNGVKD